MWRLKHFQKVGERGANVYEKKGPALSSPAQGGNVIENKCSYALKAGMLVKRKVVNVWQVLCHGW
jgi:hypothetical protein